MLNSYFEKNYNKLKDMAYNVTNGNEDKDDLLSFVIEELYNCDQEKIKDIIQKKQLTFYIARVMVNQYNSKTSRYYYKYKKYNSHIDKNINLVKKNFIDDKYDIEKEKKLQYIDDKLEEFHWFDSQLFKLYYNQGHSLNTLSKVTKINRNTIYHSINKVKKFLKNEKDKNFKSIKKTK